MILSRTIDKNLKKTVNKPKAYCNWWAPVWQGLVLDKAGRHYRRMKSALWLFAYFIICADRQTGTLKRKADTISRHMGIKARTIRGWLCVLRRSGYVETTNGGRCLLIRIKKWKTYPQRHNSVSQVGRIMPDRVTEFCLPEAIKKGQKSAQPSQKSAVANEPNDITLKKDILNVNVRDLQGVMTDKKALAQEICQAFQDENNLPLYLSYVNRYPIEIINQAYRESLKIPSNKIKKTRGALFTYLVKYYAKRYYP